MEDLFIKSIRVDENIDKNNYLYNIPAIRYLIDNRLDFDKNVTFLIGENGSGKSTIIEALALNCGFNVEGGTRNFSFSTNNTHSDLNEHLIVSKGKHFKDGFFLRAESFYNVASYIDELDKGGGGRPIIDSYGGVSLHLQSHGESFMALIRNRFSGNGLYLLDEPEAAISPERLMQLLVRIHDLEENSQFIISTHSPILMSYPNARIYELGDEGIRPVEYRETRHYRITKDFIERPEMMYRYLFEEE
jgi:predicted ATPase